MEYFPSEILFNIFENMNFVELYLLSMISNRFEDVVKVLFKRKKCFIINEAIEREKDLCLELFHHFDVGINEIRMENIRFIHNNHWVTTIMWQLKDQIQKLTLYKCSFDEINVILKYNKNITELSLENCDYTTDCFPWFPTYGLRPLSLKKLVLLDYNNRCNKFLISDEALHRTFLNHPRLESLIFSYNKINRGEPIIEIVKYLKNLKELDFMNTDLVRGKLSTSRIKLIVDSFKHLVSLRCGIQNNHVKLLEYIGLRCKKLKKLVLKCENIDNEIIQALYKFKNIEFLGFEQHFYDETDMFDVSFLPNLRGIRFQVVSLSVQKIIKLLYNYQKLQTITIQTTNDEFMNSVDNMYIFIKFNEIMINPTAKMYFEHLPTLKRIGFFSKKDFSWNGKSKKHYFDLSNQ